MLCYSLEKTLTCLKQHLQFTLKFSIIRIAPYFSLLRNDTAVEEGR